MLDFDPEYRFTKRIERDFDVSKDYNDGYKKIFGEIQTMKRNYSILRN